jgi:flagellar biosynthetic protein FliR
MLELVDEISRWLPGYMLVFARLSAMIMAMPILGYSTIPVNIRIILSFLFTLIIAPTLGIQDIVFSGMTQMVLILMKEILIGLVIGFGAQLIFEGFSMAGQFVGMQMGLAILQVFDPSSEQQQPIVTQFWMMIMIIFFLVTDSHYVLVQTLFENFTLVKLGQGVFDPALGRNFINGGALIFELAMRFAAPAVIFLLLIDIAIAFVARVMPQMNVFFVSLPLKIALGFVVLIISLRLFQLMFGVIFDQIVDFMMANIRAMSGS